VRYDCISAQWSGERFVAGSEASSTELDRGSRSVSGS